MMKRIRQWLLNLLFKQHEPTPEPTPKQEEEKIEVVTRQPVNGRTKQVIARGVEKFFNDHYDLRFNILKRTEEFRPLSSEKAAGFGQKAPGFDGGWQQLTNRELRRIAFEQMKEVGVAWSIDIELYARSTMIPDYDPIADFLSHTTPWDGTTDLPNLKQLTLALRQCHFPHGAIEGQRGWYARRRA